MEITEETFHVLRRDSGKRDFLMDVWEEHEDVDNFSFTSDIRKAMIFRDYSRPPKYLWDDLKDCNIETLEEMSDFFNGSLVKVTKQTVWLLSQS